MERICKYCGKQYDGTAGTVSCPSCAELHKKSGILNERVCRNCGIKFMGGPRAYYCPNCRAERQKIQSRDCHRRIAAGKTRKLGSGAICAACSKPYTVVSGNQRYCPDCSRRIEIERKRNFSINFYHTKVDKEQRNKDRNNRAEAKCVICGKSFIPYRSSTTCSPECSKILANNDRKKWAEENHEIVKNNWQHYYVALSNEEFERYKKRHCENYAKRKESK